jgi:hypothetical protein
MLQAGPPFLHYYCAVVLHFCILLPHVGHSSNHEYHCCRLTRKSTSVSNFYRTLKVFTWLSLVYKEAEIGKDRVRVGMGCICGLCSIYCLKNLSFLCCDFLLRLRTFKKLTYRGGTHTNVWETTMHVKELNYLNFERIVGKVKWRYMQIFIMLGQVFRIYIDDYYYYHYHHHQQH